jgi:hypothetical protein
VLSQVYWFKNVAGNPLVFIPNVVNVNSTSATCVQARDVDGDGFME